jgi:Transposase DDE domain
MRQSYTDPCVRPLREEGAELTATEVGYEQVQAWVKARLQQTHVTVVQTIAWAVLCVVVAQRVTPAAVARALPAAQAGGARARLTRVRRWWRGPALDQAVVSPQLIGGALSLLSPGQAVVVALDTTRVGKWEVWVAGIVVRGRTVPIGWAVIPYPWPKGRFRRTTLLLVQQLQRAFPAGVRWSLVADRGFPSAALFAQLREGKRDFSVRLRLSDWVTVAGVYAKVADHLVMGRLRQGQRTVATLGRGRPAQPFVRGWVVVSATVAPVPRHKCNPGTLREQAKRAHAHRQHQAHKRGRKTPPPSAVAQRYARTWVLFTTAPTVRQAVHQYAQRMSIEETFRDWHHGWGVRTAVSGLPTEAMVERLLGVICLAYSLQLQLGQRLSQDPVGQQRRVQWTVSDRVSWFWCGQRLFSDPGFDWHPWLAAQWAILLRPQPAAVPEPVPLPVLAEAA